MKSTIHIILGPALVAIAPILLLAASNAGEVEAGILWPPLIIALFLSLVIWAGWWLVLRKVESTTLLTSISLIIFFAHGHIVGAIYQLGFDVGRSLLHAVLFACWGLTIGILYVAFCRPKYNLAAANKFVMTLASVIVLIAIVQLTQWAKSTSNRESVFEPDSLDKTQRVIPEANSDLPDIYYIVLDGYVRHDQLAKKFNFDNSEFLQFLEDKGFYVADQSTSNYATTFLSLSSSLNLRYLDNETQDYAPASPKRAEFNYLIQDNDLARYLQVKGYRFIHLNTWWAGTASSALADESSPFSLPEFDRVLLKTTILSPIWHRLLPKSSEEDLLLHQFAKLETIPNIEAPTFTFAHIICPHPPYVFDRLGIRKQDPKELIEKWSYRKLYVDQLVYVNNRITEIIDKAISQSKRPPIIIVQADHGSSSCLKLNVPYRDQPELLRERMSILNAYLVPDSAREDLYKSITPVNSFRVVLNSLFGEDFPFLPDRSTFSYYDRAFDFIDVTQDLKSSSNINPDDDQ